MLYWPGGVADEDLEAVSAAKPAAMEMEEGGYDSQEEEEDLDVASLKAQPTSY